MASPSWWTWVWVNSRSWWWTGRPGVRQFMGSQRVGHNWVTELNWTELKAHLTSHSRMSGSRWVITPWWLSGSWRSFLYSSSVCSCYLFLISSASVHTISVSYWAHLCMKCSLCISNFLEEISSLSRSILFLYFFALITEEVFLISPCYSLELCIQMGTFSFSPFSLASLLLSTICKASSDNHFTFLYFFFLGDGLDHWPLYNVMNLHS